MSTDSKRNKKIAHTKKSTTVSKLRARSIEYTTRTVKESKKQQFKGKEPKLNVIIHCWILNDTLLRVMPVRTTTK